MPIWQPALIDLKGNSIGNSAAELRQACEDFHREFFNADPTGIATSPSTWSLLGEHTDYFGGIVLGSIAQWSVAVAISPNNDSVIDVRVKNAEGVDVEKHSIGVADVSKQAAIQQRTHNDEGFPIVPPIPDGGIAARLGGIAWTMIHRQTLSRDTQGLNITVLSTIPSNVGLGENAALDVATALALFQEETDEAPVRARLAEICSQSAFMFSEETALRARHTITLRAEPGQISVIDYADGSVNQAPHPVSKSAGLRAFSVSTPQKSPFNDDTRLKHSFIDEVAKAFSVESLRLLPDASSRVIDWLQAVIEVTGRTDLPTIEQAKNWLEFWDQETQRAQHISSALRSRRLPALAKILADSQRELENVYQVSTGDTALIQLCLARGALSARSSGLSHGIITLVDATHASNFATDLAEDGLLVVELLHGELAERA